MHTGIAPKHNSREVLELFLNTSRARLIPIIYKYLAKPGMPYKIGSAYELDVSVKKATSFYESHWKRKIALADPKFYKWQFIDCPASKRLDHSVVALNETTGEIAAIMGLNPRPYYLGESLKKGAELTTWVSHPELKGKGIAPKLISYIQENYEIFFGMGISTDALPVYLRLGAKYLASIPRYFRVLNLQAVERIGSVSPLGKKLTKAISMTKFKSLPSPHACSQKEIQSAWGTHRSLQNSFSRTEEYLEWRYHEHPYFDYHLVSIRTQKGKESRNTIIALRESILNSTESIVHIADVIGEFNLEVLAATEDYIKQFYSCAIAIDAYCTSERIQSVLRAADWFSCLDHRSFIELPHLFSPLETRNPATTSLIYWTSLGFESLSNMNNMYIAKSDCDLDRPTMLDINESHN